MYFTWCSSTFLRFLKFPQIKGWDLISWREPILQNGWIILSPLLYFNFRSLKDRNSSSFSRYQCVLHDAVVLFSGFWNFLNLKSQDLISWGEPIPQNSWIIWFPHLYFNFRSLKNANSLSFIRFQCILCDSAVLFSGFWNFLKLTRGTEFVGATNSAEWLNYLVPPPVFQL